MSIDYFISVLSIRIVKVMNEVKLVPCYWTKNCTVFTSYQSSRGWSQKNAHFFTKRGRVRNNFRLNETREFANKFAVVLKDFAARCLLVGQFEGVESKQKPTVWLEGELWPREQAGAGEGTCSRARLHITMPCLTPTPPCSRHFFISLLGKFHLFTYPRFIHNCLFSKTK